MMIYLIRNWGYHIRNLSTAISAESPDLCHIEIKNPKKQWNTYH